ncbi:hypothetical protein AB0I10_02045 [Streptomyces sp. NPDC050636]|uniref:hypothetical protein n=1 Tax=Streptomyces sp. NPDC050636 TaxID=3154510 RepID=UPI00342D52BE
MRKAISFASAAAAAALLLAGCGGSNGGEGKDGQQSAQPTSSAGQNTDAPGGGNVDSAALQGGWTTDALHADKGLLILAIAKDTVLLTGKNSCSGKLKADAQPVTLDLTCTKGNNDHAKGTVKSLNGKELTIAWASGKEDTFTKSEMPSGMPTDMPEGMPTDLGGVDG